MDTGTSAPDETPVALDAALETAGLFARKAVPGPPLSKSLEGEPERETAVDFALEKGRLLCACDWIEWRVCRG